MVEAPVAFTRAVAQALKKHRHALRKGRKRKEKKIDGNGTKTNFTFFAKQLQYCFKHLMSLHEQNLLSSGSTLFFFFFTNLVRERFFEQKVIQIVQILKIFFCLYIYWRIFIFLPSRTLARDMTFLPFPAPCLQNLRPTGH